MIDHLQIRAARALLNWSQADLARAARIAVSSVKNIESAHGTARRETLGLIEDVFELNGIEFTASSGVRLKNDIVSVHDGRCATSALLDDIYKHAPASQDREVLIIGLDEAFAVDTDGSQLLSAHIDRLARAGVRERILIRDGDTRFLNTPESYRWLPQAYFSRNAPIYIYGDRIAVHSGSLKRRTILIEARPLAKHLRMLFEVLWDCVSTHPTTAPVRLRLASRT